MESFSTKELRNFYYKWFRPDLQAVFVVGDVDLDKVETQIKSIFATIPKPLKSEKRNYYQPKIFSGTKVMIEKDPEYNKTSIAIHFLKKPLLDKYKLTSVPYIEEYFDSAITTLLLNRIQAGIVDQNLPISNVQINRGKFMEMTNLETFSISFETLPSSVYSAISFLSGEINRMAQYGFNSQEYGNSREMYFREIENIYDNRFSQPNSRFMERAVNHYINGYSLASIEMHFEIMKEIIYNIRSQQLNNYASALFGQKEGVVIACSMPDVKGMEELSVERIKSSFINSLSKSTAGEGLKQIVEWPKFETSNKVAHIVQQSQDPSTGSHVFILSNGVWVMLKNTTGSLDTITFRGVSKGGLSVVREN
ncbi:MAG: insulinase family protein, partial [Bacteroidia bacterium]|nr:insulinase family protein [Bacteroidia bacterium]